ncbi:MULTISPECIES: MarR family winged helix-turn-helix transcriptional regulator [Methylomonas]|uniref:MarR family transcriptional regulator n=2 Tax=Methylomonas TaxID=416 RepID=A0A126T4I3_9GAMM|nr:MULTISPECIES: MarR family transcriptional regulator [Methylomonas]AMK76986.1 MarR family transcriptional regulator [Methylomonas denitrificans]OAH98014.1 MarR family transcriptional regulator [Methylomonas methanica]TCV81165.1 MarR family transcriptional regulator [Methylomonas methanica]
MVDQISAIDNPPLDETLTPDMREAALRLAIEQFYFGYRAFTVQPDRILAERGLGRVHHRILYFVGRNPRISVNALLGMLSVSKQALNAPLRQLMDMQLVMIDTAMHDKRVRELSLTADGAELEAQLTGTQMQQLQTVFARVGANAEAGWHQVMRSLNAQG